MAPQQGMALGAFLRYCSQLVELRLEGPAKTWELRGLLMGLIGVNILDLTIAYYSLLVLSIS